MIVTPLSDRTNAVRDALLSHGWEGDLARLAAGGSAFAGFHVTETGPDLAEAMLPISGRLGLELITGPDWLIVLGARARLGAFARPWMQPEAVRDLATAIGMALPAERPVAWRHARGSTDVSGPVMVGVINVTPDSFSDGGRTITSEDALARAELLLAGGAQIIDVGGESTRPGAIPLSADDEQLRIIPVIEALVRRHAAVPLSVDTVHGATARAAIDAGAAIVNDVTAGRHDPGLVSIAATHGAGLVLSHSRGAVGRLASYDDAEYGTDVAGVVARELREAMQRGVAAGVEPDAMVLDPGFGFAKTPAQSLAMLDQLDAVVALGQPVLVGVSRKRFLGEATGRPVDDRDRATAAACALAFDRGARLFRVHDPAAVRDALAVAAAVRHAEVG